MESKCYFCLQKGLEKQINKHKIEEDKAVLLIKEQAEYILSNWNKSAPEITAFTNALLKKHTGKDDLYRTEKDKANKLLQDTYEKWKETVKKSDNPLHTALKVTVIGNIIDYGAHEVPENVDKVISERLSDDFDIDDYELLMKEINKAKEILYLGDNAGEIIFDKLFLELLNHKNIIFAVRNTPVLNDVTVKEAKETAIDKYAKVISSGFDGPSTVVKECSDEFKEIYKRADLIISKGQGNLEGLVNEKRGNIFFLLMAKCSLFAEKFDVETGALIVASQKRLRNTL